MAWDSTKVDGIDTLPSTEWNTHVTDQKTHASRHNIGGSDVITFPSQRITTLADVKASRAADGTVYQNTGTLPRFVIVNYHVGASATNVKAYSDANATPVLLVNQYTSIISIAGYLFSVSFWVLPNHYYKVTTDQAITLDTWIEYT